jgi:DNA endonuclease I-HmuI-like, NUMOD-like domain
MNVKELKDKVVTHMQEHKEAWIAGGVCFAVGLGGGLAVGGPQLIQIVDAFNFKYKSPTTTQIINMLVRRGHPGFVIKCNETGEVFASQNRMAEALGLKPTDVAQQLNGHRSHAKGYTFERLGEATA